MGTFGKANSSLRFVILDGLVMRILVLSQYWYPENGVPQRRWAWLSKLLIRAGHEVVVICPPPHYEREVSLRSWLKSIGSRKRGIVETGPSGESIVRSGYFPSGQSITMKAFNQGAVALAMLWRGSFHGRTLRGFKPDLVIGTVPAIPTSIITPVIAKRFGCPYVIDLRDAWPELLSEGRKWNSAVGVQSIRQRILSNGPLQLIGMIVEKLMYQSFKSSAGLIFTSNSHAAWLSKTMQMKGKRLVTATIRNVFPPRSKVARTSKNIENGTPLNVLYAGTLGRAQNLNNVLDAARLARDKGIPIELRFVGAGATSNELRRKIAEENLPAKVVGRVQASDLVSHYAWADTALVHLTDWAALDHAVPSKTYELMANGIHITGVVKGETASLIEELNCGVVVEPEDPEALAVAWENLLNNRSQLQVSDTAREWVITQRDEVVPQELYAFLSELGIQ